MSVWWRCDGCAAKVAQKEKYEDPPEGWEAFSRRTTSYEELHLCGGCVATIGQSVPKPITPTVS